MNKLSNYQIKLTKTYQQVITVAARSIEDAIIEVQAAIDEGWLGSGENAHLVDIKIEEYKEES